MSNELEDIENGPCYEPGDNDPINGRFVNARHKKLCVESDWRGVRGEKDEEREKQIHREEVEIFKEEAAKNNPLGLFYLGVCYLNGSDVEKDLHKGKVALQRAYKLGVERAKDFLLMYFGEDALTPGPKMKIVVRSRPSYQFKSEDAAEVVMRILRSGDVESELYSLAKEASHGDGNALLGLFNYLKGKSADADLEPEEDAFFCLYEAATLKNREALCTIGDISICSDKYRDVAYGVERLWESHELGSKDALGSLKNLWVNDLKNYTDPEYRREIRADGDDIYAMGFYYLHGICVEKDLEKAKEYFALSEKKGCFRARSMLLDLESGKLG